MEKVKPPSWTSQDISEFLNHVKKCSKTWSTPNVNVASALIFQGQIPEVKNNAHKKAVFYFESTPELYAALDNYNKDFLVPVKSFVSCLIETRRKMHEVRDGGDHD